MIIKTPNSCCNIRSHPFQKYARHTNESKPKLTTEAEIKDHLVSPQPSNHQELNLIKDHLATPVGWVSPSPGVPLDLMTLHPAPSIKAQSDSAGQVICSVTDHIDLMPRLVVVHRPPLSAAALTLPWRSAQIML
jgi:hypothetical protein